MNVPNEMHQQEILREALKVAKSRHRELDAQISAMYESDVRDELAIKRLKRHKLAHKDFIARLEDELTPDIIA